MAVIATRASAGVPLEQLQPVAGPHRVVAVEELTADGCQQAGAATEDVRVVLGAGSSDDLAVFPALDWVHSGAAGVDAWVAAGAVPAGVRLTSAAGNGGIPLAEHALMQLLQLSRSAWRWAEAQREHRWERFTHGELAGASLGIIGFGHSGSDLAAKALACHMRVSALTRTPREGAVDGVRLLHGREGLRELLTSSDYLVVTCPLTADTRGLVGAEELSWMRPSAQVVVVSRGGVVDEDALVAALRNGSIAGAALDAHPVEPLPPDSPLWDLPGVLITPHNAATTAATAERGRAILLENLRRWVAGEPLHNVVDLARGY